MDSGKKVIAAGPGNPPAVVDETADLGRRGGQHRARRVDRQQHRLHRGEGDRRGRVDRRRRCVERLGRAGCLIVERAPAARAREGGAASGQDRRPRRTRTSSARTPASIAPPDRRQRGRRAAPAGRRGRREAPVRAARAADAGAAAGARPRRGRGDRDGQARGARLRAHGGDVLAQHRPPARDGAHDQHVDLRQERLEPGRPRATAARATRRSRSRRRRARG